MDDIFVYPNLKHIDERKAIVVEYKELKDIIFEYDFAYFLGGEESGKTTLMKKTASDLMSKDFKVVIINAAEIKSSHVSELFSAFNRSFGENLSEHTENLVLLIDDFSKIKMSPRIAQDFFKKIGLIFKKIFLFLDKRDFYQNSVNYIDASFEQVEIMSFGHEKRDELYRRWFSVGGESGDLGVNNNDFYANIDRLADHFDVLMKKNIMDSRPIYILTIIQTLESFSTNNVGYSLTSYGQCYHVLLVNMLMRSRISIRNELDGVLNFISYLAFYFFENSIAQIDSSGFDYVCDLYKKEFQMIEGVKDFLLDSGIIYTRDNEIYRFSQKYIYYFCCASYISDNSHKDKIKEVISDLCQNMHNSNKANILIFLVHHLRSTSLLQDIITHAYCFLDNVPVYDMSYEKTKHFKDFLSAELDKLVFDCTKDVEEERKKKLKVKDEIADHQDIETDESGYETSVSDEEEFRIFQEATSAVRSIDVLGQIAKNRHSSLNRDELNSIMTVSYDTGLKALHFYMDIFKDSDGRLKGFIKSILMKKKKISLEDASELAISMINKICFSFCMYMIQVVSKATAHNKLLAISDAVAVANKSSPAHQLIDLNSKLMIRKDIPKSEIKAIKKENEDNYLVMMLLKQMVMAHSYLHNVDYRDQQWISNNLDIPIKDQISRSSRDIIKRLN